MYHLSMYVHHYEWDSYIIWNQGHHNGLKYMKIYFSNKKFKM